MGDGLKLFLETDSAGAEWLKRGKDKHSPKFSAWEYHFFDTIGIHFFKRITHVDGRELEDAAIDCVHDSGKIEYVIVNDDAVTKRIRRRLTWERPSDLRVVDYTDLFVEGIRVSPRDYGPTRPPAIKFEVVSASTTRTTVKTEVSRKSLEVKFNGLSNAKKKSSQHPIEEPKQMDVDTKLRQLTASVMSARDELSTLDQRSMNFQITEDQRSSQSVRLKVLINNSLLEIAGLLKHGSIDPDGELADIVETFRNNSHSDAVLRDRLTAFAEKKGLLGRFLNAAKDNSKAIISIAVDMGLAIYEKVGRTGGA